MCWRPERGPASFRRGGGGGGGRVLVAFSSPPCFYTSFSSIPTRNEVFSNTFHPRYPLLLTSEYDTTLQANMFIACNEHVFCRLGDEHLALEMNEFRNGDEHIDSAHSNFSHTHTHTASYQRLPNETYVEMITTHNYMYSPPRTGTIALRRSKRHLDAQRHL